MNTRDCPECRYIQRMIDQARNFRVKQLYAKQLVTHKINAHPHEPVHELPLFSPSIEAITDRNN